jgi:hypothetical protein
VAALGNGEVKTIRSRVSSRAIAITRCRDGKLAAFDLNCFHFGASLASENGVQLVDIEDAGTAVRCPALVSSTCRVGRSALSARETAPSSLAHLCSGHIRFGSSPTDE